MPTERFIAALSGPSVSVLDYGATGDGVTDDRASIQAAFAAGAGGDVLLPDGHYMVGTGSGYWCLTVPANTRLHGASRDGAILQQAVVGTSVRLLYVAASGVTIDTLTLDGNKSVQSVDEHRAGLFATAGATALVVHDVTAQNFTGDGFYVYQGAAATVTNVIGRDNNRNGITFGGGTTIGIVTDSAFVGSAVQQFDSEGGTVHNLVVRGNVIDGRASNDYALTISGFNGSTRSMGWLVDGNTIFGGVNVVWSDALTFTGNTIVNHTTKPAITVWRSDDGVLIEHNTATNTGTAQEVLYLAGTGPGSMPDHVLSRQNTWTGDVATTFGVYMSGTRNLLIDGDSIVGFNSSTANYSGIGLRTTIPSDDVVSVVVRASKVTGYKYGVTVAGNGASVLRSLEFSDNVFTGTPSGALYLDDGTGCAKDVMQAGNSVVGSPPLVARSPTGTPVPWGSRWTLTP